MSSGVSERALERMSATERASEASSASSAKERANSAVKQVAQHSKKVTRRFHDHSSQCAMTLRRYIMGILKDTSYGSIHPCVSMITLMEARMLQGHS